MARESQIQSALWDYLKAIPLGNGEHLADFSFHPPNGVWIPGDARASARIINSLRSQGFHPGVSDLVIAWPVAPYHGAYIELKKDKKSPISDEQKLWLKRMRRVGYFSELVIGLDAGIDAIQRYLAGKEAQPFPWKESDNAVVFSGP